MPLVRTGAVITVRLQKDLLRSIRRGHCWLFSDAIDLPTAPSGSVARIQSRSGDIIASGIYCREHPLALRICSTQAPFHLDDDWLTGRLEAAIRLRQSLFQSNTTGWRLVAGEGDGVPGLIVDLYDDTAVMKLDGGAPEDFYQPQAIAQWLSHRLNLSVVVHRQRGRGTRGDALVGQLPSKPVHFLENGLLFEADVVQGQKTGFFLDQRDNRALVRKLSQGRRVLNLFSFNGGFSMAAGMGDAEHVTSVDVAQHAIHSAGALWELNGLSPERHYGLVADAFDFLQQAAKQKQRWSLVICDPPSFAPNQQALSSAASAYAKLAQLTAAVVEPGGLLALASCSSHMSSDQFTQANLEGLGRSHRSARLICQRGLPADHPTPLAMPELRYLKFQLLELDG